MIDTIWKMADALFKILGSCILISILEDKIVTRKWPWE